MVRARLEWRVRGPHGGQPDLEAPAAGGTALTRTEHVADEQVVHHLFHQVSRVLQKSGPVATSPHTPKAARTMWQKPCVVVIVAESKLASASASRRLRSATTSWPPSASQAKHQVVARRLLAGVQDTARPRSAVTSRSRTRVAQFARRHASEGRRPGSQTDVPPPRPPAAPPARRW